MYTAPHLQRQQDEILKISSVIRDLLDPAQLRVSSIAEVTHILLCDLCEKLSKHLSDEHKGVYPALLVDKDLNIYNLAWDLINYDKPLREEFSTYKKRWLKDCEFQFTEEFIKDTIETLNFMERRLEMESRYLIPYLEQQESMAMSA